jgi:hypothetical protein
MKLISVLFMCSFSLELYAQNNVEIKAKYLQDNERFIYMETKSERLKINKADLTKEGVLQILANKDSELTLFIPPKSIVNRVAKPDDPQ